MDSSDQKQVAAAGDEQRRSSVDRLQAAAERLRPWRWKPGQSGNPKGRHTTPKRIAERYEALAAEFETPTPVERLMLQEAAKLLVRAERAGDPDISVRALGAVRRLLASLHRRRGTEDAPSPSRTPPWSPLREQLGLYGPPKEPPR